MRKKIIISLGIILFSGLSFCFAQEEITITTYYPSPYGVYRELRSKRQAIGDNYYDSADYCWPDGPCTYANIASDADLVVEGYVGIGTTAPGRPLHIKAASDRNIKLEETSGSEFFEIGIDSDGDFNVWRDDGAIGLSILDSNGYVGIGTANPSYALHVVGAIGMTVGSNSDYPTGKTIWDIAEDIPAAEDVEPADVVVIDPENNQRVLKSSKPYDISVAGIISTSPGFLIDMEDSDTPLALAGRVPCRVTAEGGSIKRGDLLVTSSKPGYAMKADLDKLKPGMIIGKALESLEEGEGKIVVLVALQ